MTTDQKGAIAEACIVAAALKLGVEVYRPVAEGGRYDMIFDIGSRLLRVQCKWAASVNQVLVVGATRFDELEPAGRRRPTQRTRST